MRHKFDCRLSLKNLERELFILISVDSLAMKYYSILAHKFQNILKHLLNLNIVVLNSSMNICENFPF